MRQWEWATLAALLAAVILAVPSAERGSLKILDVGSILFFGILSLLAIIQRRARPDRPRDTPGFKRTNVGRERMIADVEENVRTAVSVLRSAGALVVALIAAGVATVIAEAQDGAAPAPPPPNAGADYQIGGDYPLPDGVSIVLRDWFAGEAADDPAYSICYVNAFQTQANERGVDRPDERSNWPRRLVLRELGDDPRWGGEYLVDLSTAKRRRAAAGWVAPMVATCAEKGVEGVEYDNLDSWTRFDGTPLARRVPFGKREALAYAELLADHAHAVGLAVGQKNTPELSRAQVARVGFDFAIAEECGRYRECGRYTHLHDDHVIAIEYRRQDFRRACAAVGEAISVVLRDRLVTKPGSPAYVYDSC